MKRSGEGREGKGSSPGRRRGGEGDRGGSPVGEGGHDQSQLLGGFLAQRLRLKLLLKDHPNCF